jgi:SAM-dependent methyltransferase
MSTKQIQDYYNSSENSDVRPDLVSAISLLDDSRLLAESRIAIDCGCGAGSDIEFLRKNDFTVYAFDLEEESIRRCAKRFKRDEGVILSVDSFSSFAYPSASLILADASLLFCPRSEFDQVWANIKHALINKGVFCGSFLGPRDTMATTDYAESCFWPAGKVFTEVEVRKHFEDFDIATFSEIDLSGETDQGIAHHWHLFSVVAQKV